MKRHITALALLLALPFAASAADGITYNHVQGGYVATDVSGPDADGWGIGASVAIHPNVHLFGSYAKQEVDHSTVDFDQWRVGAGYNRQVGQRTDFVATAAYEKVDAGAGIKADGYSVEGGVRSMLTRNLEGYAMLGYQDGDDFKGEAYGRVGAVAKFTPNWGVAADLKLVNGGDRQWFIGPRFSW